MSRRTLVLGLFALLAAAQLAAPLLTIARMNEVERNGAVYRFRVEPVDPYDLFRGRFVRLGIQPRETPWTPDPGLSTTRPLWASLAAGKEGFATVASLSAERPAQGDYVMVSWRRTGDDMVWLEWPFDRYYANERIAPEIERHLLPRGAGVDGQRVEASIAVRVLDGRALLEELYLNGVPAPEFVRADD